MISELPLDCHKAISRWTRDDYYVYIRPISSHWINPTKKHTIYWNVLVEYRNVEWKQWRAEGKDLAEVIRELAEQIPRRRVVDPGWRPGKTGGWLAPRAVERKAAAHAKTLTKTKKKRSLQDDVEALAKKQAKTKAKKKKVKKSA